MTDRTRTEPVTVLVGFAEALAAPEVVWDLVDAGYHPLAFARRGAACGLRRSRHVELVDVAAPEDGWQRSVEDLRRLLAERSIDVLMPLDDTSLWLARAGQLSASAAVTYPPGTVAVALDKALQLDAARAAGFAVPDGAVVRSPREIPSGLAFPAVAKPADAVQEHGGVLLRSGMSVVPDRAALADVLGSPHIGRVIVQQPLEGVGEGLFGLAVGGRAHSWSAHRRVRMMNPQGSGSSACELVAPDPELVRRAETFIADCGWEGLFMLEFLRDAGGTAWFMEMNGRPWGSMALVNRAGYRYPSSAVRVALGAAPARGAPVAPAPAVPPLRARHLGRELVHLALVLRGPKGPSTRPWPARGRTLRELLRISRRDRLYNWRRDDWRVFVSDVWTTLAAHNPLRRS